MILRLFSGQMNRQKNWARNEVLEQGKGWSPGIRDGLVVSLSDEKLGVNMHEFRLFNMYIYICVCMYIYNMCICIYIICIYIYVYIICIYIYTYNMYIYIYTWFTWFTGFNMKNVHEALSMKHRFYNEAMSPMESVRWSSKCRMNIYGWGLLR